jgi:hypothetical protein
MSTLTSLVKSGKVKIVKTKTEQPERERKSVKTRQEPDKSTGSSASTRGFLGRPDEGVSQGFLSRPDEGVSRGFLGRPDQGVSLDATRTQ